MRDIEEKISPLVQSMFPSFYYEEGPNFIAFVKAYYEWLETNFQLLGLEDTTNFNVGDTVTQQDVHGTIVAYVGTDILVQIDGFNTFKCFNVCSELIPVTSSSGGSTYIERGGSSRRLSPLYMSRNLPKLRDIDKTLDLFVVNFKEKYLKNIEFDTSTNKRLLVKNSLDLYRSKGTERSIDLFFRLIYGLKASVSYPGERLFQLSASEWYVPSYIEITSESVERNIQLVGKQIQGVTSGSTAFVEKYVKRKISSGFVHLLYISNIRGEFQKNELLKSDQVYTDSPKVLGSLSSVEINTGGNNYEIGDVISFTSSTGEKGLARVSAIRSTKGIVDFELIDGGWGYTVSANSLTLYSTTEKTQTLVAEKLLTLDEVQTGNTVASISLTAGGFGYSSTDQVNIISPTSNAIARIVVGGGGAITDVVLTSPGSGFFSTNPTIEVLDSGGNPSTGSSATFSLTFDEPKQYFKLFDEVKQGPSTTGTLVDASTEGVITLTSVSQIIQVGDILYQIGDFANSASAKVIEVLSSDLFFTTVKVDTISGVFTTVKPVLVKDKSITAQFSKLSLTISVAEVGNTYSTGILYSKYSGTSANVQSVSAGKDANFEVGSISNSETVYLNTDKLNANNASNIPYLSLPISSFAFGFPKNPSANKDNRIFAALQFDPFVIGSISTFADINPGENYSTDPKVVAYQPFLVGYNFKDFIFTISNLSRSFSPGEQIIQEYEEPRATVTLVSNVASLSVGEKIYTANSSMPLVTTGFIKSVDTSSNSFVISDFSGIINSTQNVYSFSNTLTNIAVSSSSTFNEDITAKAIMISSNDTNIYAKRIQFENLFRLDLPLQGSSSGATATILEIAEDETKKQIGLNSDISTFADSTQGAISTVRILDSGLGYKEGQNLVFSSETNPSIGSAIARTQGIGRGRGYYKTSKGFLSSISKLYDGDFYQEYSYEILSRIPIDKYAVMFKRVMHTAGTRFFGTVLVDTVVNSNVSVFSSTLLIDDNSSPYVIEDRFDIDVEDRSNIDIEIRG